MSSFVNLSSLIEKNIIKSAGTHLYLLRHGQSLANHAGSIVGWTDSKLSVRGREQSNKLFQSFHKHIGKFTTIQSSDLSRCKDTLSLALGFPSKQIIFNENLRELNFGEMEGVHFDSLPEKEKKVINSLTYSAPGGQNWIQVRERALNYLLGLPEGHHLISTHGGLMCSLTYQLGITHVVPNCSVIGVELCPSKKDILNVNFLWEFPQENHPIN